MQLTLAMNLVALLRWQTNDFYYLFNEQYHYRLEVESDVYDHMSWNYFKLDMHKCLNWKNLSHLFVSLILLMSVNSACIFNDMKIRDININKKQCSRREESIINIEN